MNRDDLAVIRQNLEAQAAETLEAHHRVLGAIELLDHFLSVMDKEADEELVHDLENDTADHDDG